MQEKRHALIDRTVRILLCIWLVIWGVMLIKTGLEPTQADKVDLRK